MNKSMRFKYILLILVGIFLPFYLYLPQHNGEIQNMDKTIGVNTADVICIGSSHVFMGINPVQMYRDYGIAAYDIAGGSLSPWAMYYYVKQAIKHQHPDLIVLDTYTCISDEANFSDARAVSNLRDFPLSIDKMEAVAVSRELYNPLEVFVVFPYTYDSYDDYKGLSLIKTPGEKDYNMGYHYTNEIVPYDSEVLFDAATEVSISPIPDKSEEYLRRILEYCQAHQVDVVLTNTPWPEVSAETQSRFNYIQTMADEYGIPFINGCLYNVEIGMDYSSDSSGDGGHLNCFGVSKWTSFLCDYLTSHYCMYDRRDNKEYEVYQEALEKQQNNYEGIR